MVLYLHGADHQRRRRQSAAVEPALDYHGPGVVGAQPVLQPGESFQYTSSCELNTPTGVMRGTYQMVTEDGEHFDVEIAPFALHEPYTVH